MTTRPFLIGKKEARLGTPLLCVFDFDGTLAPLVDHPARARMSLPLRRELERLRARAGVAVLSGRAVRDVRRRVGIKGIVYGGNHGVEMEGRGHPYLHPAARRLKGRAGEMVRRARRVFKDVPGVFIEGKGFGVSLHFRCVALPFRRMFDRGVRKLKKETHALAFLWTRGHKVWDLRPPTGWNKGKALDRLWRRMGQPFTVCVGDDVTDEDMFRAVRGKGFGVKVGAERTGARYRLGSQKDVLRFIKWLNKRSRP